MVEGEVLQGDNQYRCDQCKKKVDAVRRCCIGHCPNYLVVHLKRFEFDFELGLDSSRIMVALEFVRSF